MKTIVMAAALLASLVLRASAENAVGEAPGGAFRWALYGDLGIAYLGLSDTDFYRIEEAGLGTVQEQGLVASFDFGGGIVWRDTVLLGLEANYSAGGVTWDHALGDAYSVPLYYNRLDLRAAVQLVPKALAGFYPFVGVGFGAIDDLMDTAGDGFRAGGGSVHYFGGIDIGKFGRIDSSDRHGFVALRVQIVYRPAFAYRTFYLYGSPVDDGSYGGAFDDPVGGSDVELYAGLRICYIN